jgi:hypothetical protein
VKAFLAGVLLGLIVWIGFHSSFDFESVNVGTNNTYCGFDWEHANAYCEHAE